MMQNYPPRFYGNFSLQNCGIKTAEVIQLLHLLPTALQPAIDDSSRSSASDAFLTFFKTIVYASHVHDVIYNISVGAALPGEVGTNPANIWIYCITGPGQVISGNSLAEPGEDYYLSAIQNRRTAEALPGNDTRWIFLYPKFFQYLSAPQPDPGICLKILPHFNKYVQRNLNYVNFRLWILVHELAHHYSFETHERVTEYSYANDCVALSGSDAVVNVQNYVYYIANLYNRCTNYPDWRGPWWWRKVELLEIDPHNSTTSNHTVSVTNANITLPQNNS